MSTRTPPGPTTSLRPVVAAMVIGACVALGIAPLLPPSPTPASAEAADFSADRALRHVEMIAREPRPIGSPAGAEARTYLVDTLTALGLAPMLQETTAPDYYGTSGRSVEIVNVLARIPGSDSTGAIALVAHYDTVPASPGANDDAAGVAAVLETARALLAEPQMRNDVVILLTDGEEPAPRYGATAFVEAHPWADEVRVAVVLEAIGRAGASQLVETSRPNRPLVDAYAAAASAPAASSFLPGLVDAIGGSGTDAAPLMAHGIAAMHFAHFHGSPVYHTAADDADAVDLGSLQHHGDHALGLARRFGGVDLAGVRDWSGSDVYFTVGTGVLVRYPETWALPLAAVVLAGCVSVLWRRRPEGPMKAMGLVTGALVLSGLAAMLVWRVLAGVRPSPRLGEAYGYLVALLAMAALITRTLRRRGEQWGIDWTAGVLLVWTIFAVVTAVTVPAMSHVFAWPVLGALVTVGFVGWGRGTSALGQVALIVVVAAPALVLAVPTADLLFQLAQPRPGNLDSQMLDTIGLVIVVVLLVVELIGGGLRAIASADSASTDSVSADSASAESESVAAG